MNYAYSKSRIHAADYSSVYIANLPADYDLDRCFQEFNAPNRPLRYQMSYMKQHFREPHFFIESAEGNDYFRVTPKVYDNLMGKPKKKPSREQGER